MKIQIKNQSDVDFYWKNLKIHLKYWTSYKNIKLCGLVKQPLKTRVGSGSRSEYDEKMQDPTGSRSITMSRIIKNPDLKSINIYVECRYMLTIRLS